MRMDQSQPISAWNLVNELEEKELSALLWKYGEESYSHSIARQIVKARAVGPINTTFELVDVIKKALPAKVLNKKGHPAKQTFQALRIAVNRELDSLETGLQGDVSAESQRPDRGHHFSFTGRSNREGSLPTSLQRGEN